MNGLRVLIIFGMLTTIWVEMTIILEACNEAVCDSIVGKCKFWDKCNCEIESYSCCKQCFACLKDLYVECCSCFDICPKDELSFTNLSKSSEIGELEKPVISLFTNLTSKPVSEEIWSSYTYPENILNHINISYFSDLTTDLNDQEKNFVDLQNPAKSERKIDNCTVVFIPKCISSKNCKIFCSHMGATKYRWFHTGCCECVGHICINYGINEPRCSKCSESEMSKKLDVDYDDYGQFFD